MVRGVLLCNEATFLFVTVSTEASFVPQDIFPVLLSEGTGDSSAE